MYLENGDEQIIATGSPAPFGCPTGCAVVSASGSYPGEVIVPYYVSYQVTLVLTDGETWESDVAGCTGQNTPILYCDLTYGPYEVPYVG